MDLKLLKMRCKDGKQHHVMFHELYSVSLLLCIAQNVRFEIPYKVLYFETPFLMIFKYYAWVSCEYAISSAILKIAISRRPFFRGRLTRCPKGKGFSSESAFDFRARHEVPSKNKDKLVVLFSVSRSQ